MPVLPVDRQFRYLKYSRDLALVSVELCYVQPFSPGIDTSLELIWYLSSALIAA
jgi:hypothetical protein